MPERKRAPRPPYPREVRDRAVRMVFEHQDEYPSQWKAIESISAKLSISRRTDSSDIPGLADLSGRQWEVVTRLARGPRAPAIAQELYVSQSTVRNHLTEVFRKVGVRSQAELLQLLISSE